MNSFLRKIKYPKFILLIATIIIAYFIFSRKDSLPFINSFLSLGYIGTFLTGIFFAYGFSAAPATAILLILAKQQNIIACGLIAGLGALAGDLIIFKFIRHSFKDEIRKISKEGIFKLVDKNVPRVIRAYIIPVFAGAIIASPLPDEIGVALLAAGSKISIKAFLAVSYVLNTAGIFVILLIGRSI